MHSSEESRSAETKIDRATRRRIRRWQRRARAVAPLLAVPAMLGLLILSVDLIEYQPGERGKHERPPATTAERLTEPDRQAFAVDPQNVSTLETDVLGASVVGSTTMPSEVAMPSGAPLASGMGLDAARDAARFVDPMQPMPSSSAPRVDDLVGTATAAARPVR